MIKSLNHFEAAVGYSRKEIIETLTHIDNYYYHFEKIKSSGKIRHFHPSEKVLKDIQNRLVSRIFCKVQFPFFITGSVKRRSNVLNAKIHSGKLYHLQTDLVSFFDFVSNCSVYKTLLLLGFSPDIASLITKLTTYQGHLPQGAPTSPFLANLVGLPMDFAFIETCKQNGTAYSRYVDDINFSNANDFKLKSFELLEVVRAFGFRYSHKKTVYKVGGIDITGVHVTCNGIWPTEELDKKISNTDQTIRKLGLESYRNYIQKVNASTVLKGLKRKTFTYPEKLTIKKVGFLS